MAPSKLDSIYRRMLITRFFEKGWGKPENLQRLFEFRKVISRRETCYKLIPYDYPITIVKTEKYSDYSIFEGKFITPLELHLPGIVPKAAQEANFQVLMPQKWNDEKYKPMCIHLAGTGDHFYWRRRNFLAKPILKEANIGAIILENPFYGLRKPDYQVRSNLNNVSDIFVMGGCLILECLVLLHWCERNGLGPLGITGLSMGGHMASLAATNWPKPLVLVPCLSWSTASTVFTTGVMSQSINWDMLETQYHSDGKYSERLSKMVTVIDDAFTAGQKFIKHFNQSLNELRKDINDTKHQHIQEFNSIEVPSIIQANKLDTSNVNIIKKNVHRKQQQQQSVASEKKTEKQNVETLPSIKREQQSTLTKLMEYILPKAAHSDGEKIDITKTNWFERDALQFMRGMMDECTHLKNFSVPFDTSLIIAVCAIEDAYVPREGCSSLEDIWPGVEVRYLKAGHVSAYVLHQKLFRSCIIEAFERAKKTHTLNIKQEDDNLKPTLTYQELINNYTNSI